MWMTMLCKITELHQLCNVLYYIAMLSNSEIVLWPFLPAYQCPNEKLILVHKILVQDYSVISYTKVQCWIMKLCYGHFYQHIDKKFDSSTCEWLCCAKLQSYINCVMCYTITQCWVTVKLCCGHFYQHIDEKLILVHVGLYQLYNMLYLNALLYNSDIVLWPFLTSMWMTILALLYKITVLYQLRNILYHSAM